MPHDEVRDPATPRGFLVWGCGAFVVTTAILVARGLRSTGGAMVYVLDDPAIHLSVARNLVDHGTWGVTGAEFQSASSAPAWTALLALLMLALPAACDAWLPLALNVLAAVGVVAALATSQAALRPASRRPIHAAAAVGLVTIVLFLPGLALTGMEHTAHIALTLAALVHWSAALAAKRSPAWWFYAAIVLATLVRLETAFLAVGLAAATLVGPTASASGKAPGGARRRSVAEAVAVLVAAAAPIGVVVLANRRLGGGWLPNSVLAKAQLTSGQTDALAPLAILTRLGSDPLVAALFVALLGIVLLGWRDRHPLLPQTVAVTITIGLHVTFAALGWFERYQAYLIALAVMVLLRWAATLSVRPNLESRDPRSVGPLSVAGPVLVLLAVLLSTYRIDYTWNAPAGMSDTFDQRYQAARFLARYYDGRAVATSELGYVSLFHDGPLTDVLGLGDREVLAARRAAASTGGSLTATYWEELAARRGTRVVAVYPSVLAGQVPDRWVLVGEWHLDRKVKTAYEGTFQFFAADPAETHALEEHLREFTPELPARVRLTINPLAGLKADALTAPASP